MQHKAMQLIVFSIIVLYRKQISLTCPGFILSLSSICLSCYRVYISFTLVNDGVYILKFIHVFCGGCILNKKRNYSKYTCILIYIKSLYGGFIQQKNNVCKSWLQFIVLKFLSFIIVSSHGTPMATTAHVK